MTPSPNQSTHQQHGLSMLLYRSTLRILPNLCTGTFSEPNNGSPIRSIDLTMDCHCNSWFHTWSYFPYFSPKSCSSHLRSMTTVRRWNDEPSMASVGHVLHFFSICFLILMLEHLFCKTNTKLVKTTKKGSRHTQLLSKMHWKHLTTTIHQYPQLQFVVCSKETQYESKQHFYKSINF